MPNFVQWLARIILGGNLSMDGYVFPKTIAEFGYKFNSAGELRKIDRATGQAGSEPFLFNVRDDNYYNQKHYEALGEAVTEYIYKLLELQGLQKLPVPKDAQPGELQSFIFATPGALESEEQPLLVLVHGSGEVRAGQWARSLIINDNLHTGTQIPYIETARKLGYGVLVLNTNDNYRDIGGKKVGIKNNESPEEHIFHVWDNYIIPSKPKKIAIVAHSYGGVCTSYLSWERLPEFRERVFAVAMTDSVHYVGPSKTKEQEQGKQLLRQMGRNWKASSKPLDTPIEQRDENDVPGVSAGHAKHVMTSASAINSVFAFIEEKRHGVPVTPAESVAPADLTPAESVAPVTVDTENDKVETVDVPENENVSTSDRTEIDEL